MRLWLTQARTLEALHGSTECLWVLVLWQSQSAAVIWTAWCAHNPTGTPTSSQHDSRRCEQQEGPQCQATAKVYVQGSQLTAVPVTLPCSSSSCSRRSEEVYLERPQQLRHVAGGQDHAASSGPTRRGSSPKAHAATAGLGARGQQLLPLRPCQGRRLEQIPVPALSSQAGTLVGCKQGSTIIQAMRGRAAAVMRGATERPDSLAPQSDHTASLTGGCQME